VHTCVDATQYMGGGDAASRPCMRGRDTVSRPFMRGRDTIRRPFMRECDAVSRPFMKGRDDVSRPFMRGFDTARLPSMVCTPARRFASDEMLQDTTSPQRGGHIVFFNCLDMYHTPPESGEHQVPIKDL